MSDKLEANDCLEIYESRGRLGLFLAGAIVITLIGLLMMGACIAVLLGVLDPPRTAVETAVRYLAPYPLLLVGVLNIILFGSAGIQTTGRLLGKRHPVLFLTREGFKDIRISSEWIPWSTVLSLNDFRGAGIIEGLILDVDPQFVLHAWEIGSLAIEAYGSTHFRWRTCQRSHFSKLCATELREGHNQHAVQI
jgi:hypothetical protein